MPNSPAATNSAGSQQQQNMMARQYIIAKAIDAWQQIFTTTVTANTLGNVLNIPLRPVGLVKRLVVEVAAQVSGSAGVTHTLTNLGMSNFFSNVTLSDLSNQIRINTTGWHLTTVASAKARIPYGSSVTGLDTPFGYGNNFRNTCAAPATVTATTAANNVFGMFEIPLAYSDQDLRGSIYAGVINAVLNLQLTVNASMFVASTATDPTLAVYQSNGATLATLPSFTLTIYQNYLDQIPINPKTGNPILPIFDLSTAYLLNNTAFTGLVVNQDFPMQYANFRDFLSTTVIYDNAGVLNTGSDVAYFAIQAANYTNIIKEDPNLISLINRLRLQADFPKGMYYFDHRLKPINSVQYGNIQLLLNASAVTTGASLLVGYESLAVINQVVNAGSLAAN